MAAFLEPPDGRKTQHAIIRLHVRKNCVKTARNIFPGNRIGLRGMETDMHGNPQIPRTCQWGESSRTHGGNASRKRNYKGHHIRRHASSATIAAPVKRGADRPKAAGQEASRWIVTTFSISNQLSSLILCSREVSHRRPERT